MMSNLNNNVSIMEELIKQRNAAFTSLIWMKSRNWPKKDIRNVSSKIRTLDIMIDHLSELVSKDGSVSDLTVPFG